MTLDFPIALQLRGKRVLLVGAGRIAEGRLLQLLEVGARVRVVAPNATPAIHRLAEAGQIELEQRGYALGDCSGASVIFTAADDAAVNRAVVAEARALGILANAADAPELCDFTIPSIGRRGPVTVAVSTSGQAPALARALRLRAMEAIGPEFGTLARLLGRLRRLDRSPKRAERLQKLVDSDAAELIARGDKAAVWKRVRKLWRGSQQPKFTEVSP
jgi:precorrin-2 dehydrogenase / sirohydrochlorin ferrochelatase